MKFQI